MIFCFLRVYGAFFCLMEVWGLRTLGDLLKMHSIAFFLVSKVWVCILSDLCMLSMVPFYFFFFWGFGWLFQ